MTALARAPRFFVLRLGPLSARVGLRPLVVTAVLWVATIALGAVALTLGEYPIPLPDILAAFAGEGSDAVLRIVVDGRLPRVLIAIVAGAALGLSGAIFQSLTRNPLGSPDIIGFNTGAYSGALVVIVLLGGGYLETASGALIGGLVTALAVYVLAFKRGVQGFRLIVVGIAVSAALQAGNSWIIITAQLDIAVAAATWGAGSFNGLSWRELTPLAVVVVALVVALLALTRPLRALELGDDSARALGVSVERSRLWLVVVGVALTAVVTAAAGPIAFVALAAPQVAARLARSAGVALIPAAAMGAAMTLASDVVSQRLFAPLQLPIGVVTVCVGGAYLAGLLAIRHRRLRT